jgi:Zn-dependent peptidase ImmA (M78 family)
VKIDLSPNILQWINGNVRIDEMSDKAADYLTQWNDGKTPTYNQIEYMSHATGIPFGYFLLETPPKEQFPIMEYRTIDSVGFTKPSRNLIDTIHDMEMIQDWLKNSENNAKENLSFVGAQKGVKDIKKFASYIRSILGMKETWFAESRSADDSFHRMRNFISSSGVTVMMNGVVENNTHRSLDIEEFRAFAMVDEVAPIIFINSNDSINGRLFSLIHEFAHICSGKDDLFNDRYSDEKKVTEIETICNAVAAELLVPDRIYVVRWNDIIKNNDADKTIELLSKYFRCGTTVIARRALDHKYIDYAQYRTIAKMAVNQYNENKKKNKDTKGGNFYYTTLSRIDHRFLNALEASVEEGETLYSDAYRLTHTNRNSFDKLVETVQGYR